MQSGFQWVVSPEVIAKGLDDYGYRALVAIQAAATYWGQNIQDAARKKQKWNDRTGNARSGLFFAVDGFGFSPITGVVDNVGVDMYLSSDGTKKSRGRTEQISVESGDADTLIITLGHTVYYGKYLEDELNHGGKYAVIMSTIEENLPMLQRLIEGTFRG